MSNTSEINKTMGVAPTSEATNKRLNAAAKEGEQQAIEKENNRKSKDVETPKPATGPMATGGPNGTSESLPKTTEPFAKATDCSPAMSMDAIKAMGKRIGRY